MMVRAGLFITALFFGVTSLANIPAPMQELKIIPPAVNPIEKSPVDQELVKSIIPTDMPQTDQEGIVENKIMDHSFRSLVSGWLLKKSPFASMAQKIENATKPNVSFKSGSNTNAVEHKLEFQFEPSQQIANLQYTGFLKSNFIYTVPTDALTINTVKPLNPTMRIGLVYNTTLQKQAINRWGNIYYSLDF